MMKLQFFYLRLLKLGFLFIFSIQIFSQSIEKSYTVVSFPEIPQKFCDLSKKINESSGLIYWDNYIWTFNDSGGKAEIYKIDSATGEFVQTVKLNNAKNTDWEDITHDEDYIYIGDFGNNIGTRNDLRIYKVNKSMIDDGTVEKVPSEIIAFSYNDQISFTVNNRSNNYDCESLISFGDSLIIFSKNWINGKTRMYKMPKTPGKYGLDPIDSFNIKGLATGADYNPDINALILIGYQDYVPFLFYFTDFDGQQLGNHKVYKVKLSKMKDAQTEGVCWFTEDVILISTEQTSVFPQAVFQLNPMDVVKHID
jgi:hypothetical protein